jgi:DNA-binding transcriptional regulator YiaG
MAEETQTRRRQAIEYRKEHGVSAAEPVLPGRKRLTEEQAKALRERIWVVRAGRPDQQFADEIGVPVKTVRRWQHPTKPKAPDLRCLMEIANKCNVSLNWLLLGEGIQLRTVTRDRAELTEDLRAMVITMMPAHPWQRELAEQVVPDGADLLQEAWRLAETRYVAALEDDVRVVRISVLQAWAKEANDVEASDEARKEALGRLTFAAEKLRDPVDRSELAFLHELRDGDSEVSEQPDP